MMTRMRVVTIVGTRPEIIRLSRVIAALDEHFEHLLVHTGQNYDYELRDVFFDELEIRRPDVSLDADPTTPGTFMGDVLRETESLLLRLAPSAVVILGDTNSSIAAVMARRLKIPVYHLEAGNRSFDPNVPEEVNRKLVDHVADYHLVYSEHSRRNLLAEGVPSSSIVLIGSPMNEVLTHYAGRIRQSSVLAELGLQESGYVLASTHREENVDDPGRLDAVVESLLAVGADQGCPVVVSTHPRTRRRLEDRHLARTSELILHKPLGFLDYVHLQQSARCVVSDSGTIAEESSILAFPAVTIRDAIERPEAIDAGSIITTGLNPQNVVDSVRQALWCNSTFGPADPPWEYRVRDTSRRVVNLLRSTASTHHARTGLRVRPVENTERPRVET